MTEPEILLPKPGVYRDYTGAFFHLAWLARRESDGEIMCCYFAHDDFAQWVRPASEWYEWVMPGVRRYTRVREAV